MKILLLSAHIDDADTGCGGSVAKFIEEGNDIYYVAFSSCEESVPEGLPKDILLSEVKLATKILGIKPQNLLIYEYPVRRFPQLRQEILEDLVKLNKRIKPDLVFMPSKYDLHQDHYTIIAEGIRAFKLTSIFGYELPWNNINFAATSFVHLKEAHVRKKLKVLECYKSQKLRAKQLGKRYVDSESIKGLARIRGTQIGTVYAEAFNVVRWIIK